MCRTCTTTEEFSRLEEDAKQARECAERLHTENEKLRARLDLALQLTDMLDLMMFTEQEN